jgi:ABC-type dipeptide/oligopeptide/nickel transport system permease subunit
MRTFFPWRRLLRSGRLWFSVAVMLFFGLVAIGAPWLAPHDPYRSSIVQSHLPPMWVRNEIVQGRAEFPLGTDMYGRDVLSRLIYGTRTAFFLACAAVPTAALIGTLLGLIAGYYGGRLDSLIVFLVDLIQSLPGVMFLVIIVLIFRSIFTPTWVHGLITLIIGFAAVAWVGLARLVRVNVLMIKAQSFVEAARALGASPWQMLVRHFLPNIAHVIMVWIINNIPAVILLESLLGYIGVGATRAVDGGEFTIVSWGGLFFVGRSALSRNPLILFLPSLCILLLAMSFIMLGDLLQETDRPGS